MFNNTSPGRRDSMTPIVAPGYRHSWALPSLNQTIAPLSITKNPSGHAAEVHRYKVIIVENVVEFATRWELCDWWIAGLMNLCYTVQLISVSSVPLRLGT
jgi:hypothetical protein